MTKNHIFVKYTEKQEKNYRENLAKSNVILGDLIYFFTN